MFGLSSLYIKLAGGILAAVLLAGLVADRGRWMSRAHLDEANLVTAKATLATTEANYRAAAAQAKADDLANAQRVESEQNTISQESSDAYEKRLADARATADRLRAQLAAAAHSGSTPGKVVPGVPAAPGGPAQAASDDGFSISERLVATEQAIQLDELIRWVKKQAGVDVNGNPPKSQGAKP